MLRVLHGAIFAGFTAITLVGGWPEVVHLVHSQLQPYNAGPPPRLALLVAVVMAGASMAVILVRSVRGRSAPLHWSALILGALALATWGNQEGAATGRTADAANLRILRVARQLHGRTVSELQAHGEVPEDVGSWETALAQVTQGEPTSVRTRSYRALPFRLQKVDSPEAIPAEAPPGSLFLYVMEGGGAYELHAVGISPKGEPWPLREPRGEPLVFRGMFNPELPPPAEGEHPPH
ncbi:hypothetical protein [Archangium sp.]|jgi:hypothetical protein|uniref:hypothetical protein n=1 Tax=Archangium sp. TaxID=1872627 RepID=UPI002EDB9302